MFRQCKVCNKEKELSRENFDTSGRKRDGSMRFRHECKLCRSDIESQRRQKRQNKNGKKYKQLQKKIKTMRQKISSGYDASVFETKICANKNCRCKGEPQPISNFTTSIMSEDFLRNQCNTCIIETRMKREQRKFSK